MAKVIKLSDVHMCTSTFVVGLVEIGQCMFEIQVDMYTQDPRYM